MTWSIIMGCVVVGHLMLKIQHLSVNEYRFWHDMRHAQHLSSTMYRKEGAEQLHSASRGTIAALWSAMRKESGSPSTLRPRGPETGAPAQQRPAHVLQFLRLLLTHRPQACALGATNLIHRLVQVGGDMKTIQHVQCLSGFARDNIQVGLPHIAADKAQPLDQFRPQRLQPAPQRRLRPSFPDPQQTSARRVDLIDHGQEVVRPQPVAPMNLVHAQRFHPQQLALGQAPLHEPFHRAIDRFPTSLEYLRRFSPTQPPRPAGQKAHHGAGHRTFAVTPGNLLHHHAMRGTLDPPRGVAIPGRDSPQRHKLPASFRQTVIARCRSLAQRAAPAHTAMRRDPDLNEVRLPSAAMHPYLFVHETRKTLYSIQDGFNLQLNSWSPRSMSLGFGNCRLIQSAGVQLFFVPRGNWKVHPSSGRWEK